MLLLTNLAAALFMTGLVWFVQIVHYPLYGSIGAGQFAAYEATHTRLTSYVVAIPMLVELLASVALVVYPPIGMRAGIPWMLAAMTGLIWFSTVFLQIPQHDKLVAGFDLPAADLLVSTNWIRTTAWTLRSGVLLWLTSRSIAGLV